MNDYQMPNGYQEPPVKPKKRRTWIWILIAVFVVFAASRVKKPDQKEETKETERQTEAAPVETRGSPAEPSQDPAPEEPESGSMKNGKYTVADVEFQYSGFVLGDKTGKWTKATCYSATPPDSIVREIVEAFKPESGVPLWICNLYLNTTTRILSWGTTVDVTVTEYVKGEENRADILGTGAVLLQTSIDLTEGDSQ